MIFWKYVAQLVNIADDVDIGMLETVGCQVIAASLEQFAWQFPRPYSHVQNITLDFIGPAFQELDNVYPVKGVECALIHGAWRPHQHWQQQLIEKAV